MAQKKKPTPPPKLADPPAVPSALAWRAVAIVTGLFAVYFTVPWQPTREQRVGEPDLATLLAPIGGFDFSWMQVLHHATATGMQFGRDVILPQGPLGFIGNNVYDPRTYWFVIFARTTLALLALWPLYIAARKFIARPGLALAWLIAIIALIGRTPDHLFPACSILLVFTYFIVNERKLTRSALALAVVLAASSLIKVNQPFYAIVSIGAVVLDQLVRRDKWCFALPATYLASILAFYFASRQSPVSLPTFLWGWFQVTAGHADAVHRRGPIVDVLAYLLVVACILVILGVLARKKWGLRGVLLPVLGTAGPLLLIYKHSFMRQDAWHVHMAPMVGTAAALLITPAVWRAGGGRLRSACVVVIALSTVVTHSILSGYDDEGVPSYLLAVAQRCGQNVSAAVGHLTDPGRLTREWEAERAQVRRDKPLSVEKVVGTVDVYPHRQDVLLAYDFDYKPRPVISSLVATSPTLADLNKNHLHTPAAAKTLLFEISPIDHNVPTMLDGASLPEIMTLYDVIDTSGRLLVLRRSASPRTYRFTPAFHTTGRLGEPVVIPSEVKGPLWARITFKKRTLGKVLSMLYKPPMLSIEVHVRSGYSDSYRLLPTMSEEQGFLLSPLVINNMTYSRLVLPSWEKDLDDGRVTSFTVSVTDGPQEASYDSQFEVDLQRLDFERQVPSAGQ